MGDQTAGANKRPPEILDIMEWIQCFSIYIYIAIISGSKPKRTADLIGYQSIIIGASQLGHEGRWILYDRRFRLKASASCTRQWSTIDITIWSMAFPTEQSKVTLDNASIFGQPLLIILGICLAKTSLFQREGQSAWIGMIAPMVNCTRANCRYEHVCYRCIHSPKEKDKHHKASQCVSAQRPAKQSERPRPLLP